MLYRFMEGLRRIARNLVMGQGHTTGPAENLDITKGDPVTREGFVIVVNLPVTGRSLFATNCLWKKSM